MAPRVSIGQSANETFAAFHISSTSAETRRGTPWPPYSGSHERRVPAAVDELPVGVAPAGRR